MVENHVHHHFYATLLRVGHESRPVGVSSEARIDFIIIGGGVAVVRTARHIVFEHGAAPYGRHTQRVDVVEMVADALDIAAVARGRLRAVCFGIVGKLSIGGNGVFSLGKAVGHEEVEHIGGIEALIVLPFAVARQQRIIYGGLTAVEAESYRHLSRPGVRCDSEVEELVVGAVEFHLFGQRDAGIIGAHFGIADAGSRHHNLECVVVHSHPPAWRLYIAYHRSLFRSEQRCAGHNGSCKYR